MGGALVVILMILGLVVSAGRTKKKPAGQARGRAAQPPRAGAEPAAEGDGMPRAAEASAQVFEQALAELERKVAEGPEASLARAIHDRYAAVRRPRRAREEAPRPSQGLSPLDEAGCLGGSMDHEHTEGEGREEHARHLAEIDRRETEERRAAAEAQSLTAMNAAQLRRAVVAAEILGRPRALRGQGRRL